MKKVGILLLVIGIMSLSGCVGQEIEYTDVDLELIIENPEYYQEGFYRVVGYVEPVVIDDVWGGYWIVAQLHTEPIINSSSIPYQFYIRRSSALMLAYVGKVMPEPITRVVDVDLNYGVWILKVPE